MEGYFKIHRKILDSQVFAHPIALKIWVWILARAGYSDRFVPFKINRGETTIKLQPGQFIFGRLKAEDELNIDGSTIYKWIQKFASEDFDMISIKSNNHYTIVTINHWEQYQNGEHDKVTTKEQPSDSQVTAKEQPCNTNNNNKESKESKERYIVPPTFEMVDRYCKERNNGIDPQYFIDKNTAIGWIYGNKKTKIVDWQAHMRTWEKNKRDWEHKPASKLIMPA